MDICHSLTWNPHSDYRKLLCEFSKLSKLNGFIALGYYTNCTCLQIPPRENWFQYVRNVLQLSLLVLVPCIGLTSQEETPQYHNLTHLKNVNSSRNSNFYWETLLIIRIKG